MRIFAALLAVLLAGPALGQVIPQTIPYQGYLTDQNGAPIAGEVSITFRLYAASQGGAARWEETHDGVTVDDGVFVVQLGETEPISGPLRASPGGYLAIQVEDDEEATPRQKLGSVPYALLAYDSQRLGGELAEEFVTNLTLQQRNYLTREEILNLINENGGGEGGIDLDDVATYLEENGYLTRAEILELIGDGQGITIEALAAYLEENGYVTFDALAQYLIDNGYLTRDQILALLEGYVTDDELAAALDGYVTDEELAAALDDLDFIDAEELAAALDNAGFLDAAAVDARIDAAVADAVAAAVAAAVAQLGNVQTPYILGVSAATNGRISVNNENGVRGAGALCRAAFANDARAHMCSPEEAQAALSAGSYDANSGFNNVATWAAPTFRNFDQTCQGLLYNSGDAATGTTQIINLNYQSIGGGGGLVGPQLLLIANQACGGAHPILCCR